MRTKNKFLTIYAVLDNATQSKLNDMQQTLIDNKLIGTQTKNIPYHISLGSFPLNMQDQLENKIKEVCQNICSFSISLTNLNHFNNKVLFIEPQTNNELLELHKLFEGNYADKYDWTPHITLFCGNILQTKKAKKLLKNQFSPFSCAITSIQMGEFFPTKIIIDQPLQTK